MLLIFDFILGDIIGSGNFGNVHKGTIIGSGARTKNMTVAIKSLSGFSTEKEIADFFPTNIIN